MSSTSNETEADHEDEELSMSISNDEESICSDCSSVEEYGEFSYRKMGFKWQIKNFRQEQSRAPVGDLWKAATYRFEDLHWYLTMYPKGLSKTWKEFLAFHVDVKDEEDRDVTVTLFIIDSDEKEVNKRTTGKHRFKLENHGKFFRDFIKLDELFNSPNLLPDDTLTIGCEILFDMDLCHIQNTCLDEFEELFESSRYSDMKFLVEGKEILGHRAIIASKSPVFAAMFTHEMKENDENIVKVTDFSFDVMYELLRFIYAGKVKDIGSIAPDLLMASEKYLIEKLKLLCEIHLGQDICFKNVAEYLNLANMCNGSFLKRRCSNFISEQKEAITDTPISKSIYEVDEKTWKTFFRPIVK